MSSDLNQLKEIVEIARDGEKFYRDAERNVGVPSLRPMFARLAGAKHELVEAMSHKIEADGETAPQSGTFAGAVRKVYADVAAALSSKDAAVFVVQLEATEERLQHQIERAAAEVEDPSIRLILQAYLPSVRASHDEMRALKRRLSA